MPERFFRQKHDLEVGQERRGISFHIRNGHPYSLKIRLETNREQCMDFYCNCDGDDEDRNNNQWEKFISFMTNEAEDHDQWEARMGRIRHYLVKRTRQPVTQQYCEDFYNLFARFDQFLETGKC